jgi:two-component system invasion response regulator UvrY
MITILLVDDHPIARFAVRSLLETQGDIKIVGEASTGEEDILLTKQLNPDIVLMDLDMPGIGGFEASIKLLRSMPDIKIIILTSQEGVIFFEKLMYAGVLGYLTKRNDSKEIIHAIRKVNTGRKYIEQEIADKIAGRKDSQLQKIFESLSAREIQILWMVSRGETAVSIAKKLNIAHKTVNTHRYNLHEKLNVKTDVELMHFALYNGLIEKDPLHE